jgi:hypothetical protein
LPRSPPFCGSASWGHTSWLVGWFYALAVNSSLQPHDIRNTRTEKIHSQERQGRCVFSATRLRLDLYP